MAVSIGLGGGPGTRTRTVPPRVPPLGDTLMRTILMTSDPETERAVAEADLVLRPESTGVGLLEFHQIDRMREAGRRVTRESLPRIAALLG